MLQNDTKRALKIAKKESKPKQYRNPAHFYASLEYKKYVDEIKDETHRKEELAKLDPEFRAQLRREKVANLLQKRRNLAEAKALGRRCPSVLENIWNCACTRYTLLKDDVQTEISIQWNNYMSSIRK